jgi:phospholipid/cholesterol/gamma-HCH transport system permease protein
MTATPKARFFFRGSWPYAAGEGLVGIGRRTRFFLQEIGALTLMSGRILRSIFARPLEIRATLRQMEELGVRSLGIATTTALSVGMVMALQSLYSLSRFGAKDFVGRAMAIAISRELGPVLTALMVGGRIGAGMAAEVGSMAVTEQLDAIRALGADPIKKIVMPRVLATVLVLPLLTILADIVGFLGALAVSSLEEGVDPQGFFQSGIQQLKVQDFTSGIGKTLVFGWLIGLIGCHHGFWTAGGTEGVGRSTTRTVVVTSIAILVGDFLLTKLFMML